MTNRDIRDYLQDIISAINSAEDFIRNMNFADFENDQKTLFAVTRAVEIIGEATKQIPSEIREKYNNIPWKAIAGMRDKMIHHYFGIDLQVLWDTVKQDLPLLKPIIQEILNNLNS